MDNWNEAIARRQNEIEKIIRMAEKDLRQAPKGTLHVSKRGKSFQYFYYDKDETENNHHYIRQSDMKLAKQLAQKEYAGKIMNAAKSDQSKLKKMSLIWQESDYADFRQTMPEGKQRLVSPYIPSDDEYAELWLKDKRRIKAEYDASHESRFPDLENEIITEQGERVKSKSEKIIADKYYMMHIPYVYEIPLHLNGYGDIRPDFILLNKRTRKTLYHEHLGLMSQSQYYEKAVKKIETYERNNMYPGHELLLTYETDFHPLDIKILEGLIKRFLL